MALYGDFKPTGDLAFAYDAALRYYGDTGHPQIVFEYVSSRKTFYWFIDARSEHILSGMFRTRLRVPLKPESDLT